MDIYVDDITPSMIEEINDELNITVHKRPKNWSINELLKYVTDPNINLIVINKIDSQSIVEIALAHLFCKRVLVTCNNVKEYPHIYEMVSEVQPGCNLMIQNNSFINWCKYTK